jgi:hypothetical protein
LTFLQGTSGSFITVQALDYGNYESIPTIIISGSLFRIRFTCL